MTPAETLQESLGNWVPAGAGRHSWAAAVPGTDWQATLAADHNDRVACLAWELVLTRPTDAPGGPTPAAWADRVAGRSAGLMEKLRLLERDAESGEALLRSDAPTVKNGAAFYYEVRLSGTTKAVVRRFEGHPATGAKREQVAFPVTHEALATLIADVTAAG